MSTYWSCLKQMWLAVIFGTVAGCAIVALLFLLFALATESQPLENFGVILGKTSIFAFFGGLICLAFGLLFGAPLGAWLFRRGWATPWTAAGAGCVPGLAWWGIASDPVALVFPLLFGVPVALSTYDFARRRLIPPKGASELG